MIRAALPDDVPKIRACARQAYEKYVERIGKAPAPMVADFAAQVEQAIVHVAVSDDGQLEGFIVFYPRDDHLHLENLAVSPHHQGKGVGRRLIGFCEAAALAQGLDAVELYTNAKMTENLALYPRLGYREIGRRSEDGFDRVFYRKALR